mgnify:FL=1
MSLPSLPQNSAILVEDNVPGFVQSLIRDFLRNRGFEGTLRAFDYELKNPGTTADDKPLSKAQPSIPITPSIRAWYEMSEQLGLTNLMERNRKSSLSYPTLLEVMTREMVDTNLGKKGMSHLKLRRRTRAQSETSPQASSRRSPRTSPRSHNNSIVSLAEMSNDDLQRDRAYNKKKASAKEWMDDMNEYQRMQVKEFQLKQSQKSNIQLEQRSVVDLQREMEKSKMQSPARGRHHFRSEPIKNEAKIKKKMDKQKQRRKTRKAKRESTKNMKKVMDGSDGLGDHPTMSGMLHDDDYDYDDDDSEMGGNGLIAGNEEPEIHLNPIDAMRKFMFHRSKESWIPWNQRFKMLRKDIAVQKLNNMEQANFFDLLEKNEISLDYLSLERSKEKYSGKGKTKCALCLQPYLKCNLPMQISFKAIMDLRGQWGLGQMGRGMGLKVPACYNKVAICLYCSQYFDEEQSYRIADSVRTTGADAPDIDGLGASFLLGGKRGAGGNRVSVEIFRAGDGRNYPKKGHYAIIHYNAYLSSGMLFGRLFYILIICLYLNELLGFIFHLTGCLFVCLFVCLFIGLFRYIKGKKKTIAVSYWRGTSAERTKRWCFVVVERRTSENEHTCTFGICWGWCTRFSPTQY